MKDDLQAQIAALPVHLRDELLEQVMSDVGRKKKEQQRRADAPTLTLPEFAARFHRGYVQTAFQTAIDDMLNQIALYIFSEGKEGINRVIIELPPRHGKSLKVSRLFPAWMLTRNPALKLMTCSYSATLAHSNSKAIRSILQTPTYQELFPFLKFSGRRADRWETSEQGGIMAAGVLGHLAGWGYNVCLIDDATGSRADAESPTHRQRLKEWFTSDLLTRAEPPSAIVVMGTRWSSDDLSGWLQTEEPDKWKVLRLPALAEDGDPLGRQLDQALWEDRYPAHELKEQRERDEYAFASLYQQRPVPRGQALFDTAYVQIVDTAPPVKRTVRFYDLAVSGKNRADYSVGLKLAECEDGRLIVLHIYRKQAIPTETAHAIKQNAFLDTESVHIRLEADNSARVQLDFLLNDPQMRPYTIDSVSPQGDKFTRATPVASRVNAGKLILLRGSWNQAFLDELAVFPAGRNDDQVDSLSGAYHMIVEATHKSPGLIVMSHTGLYGGNRNHSSSASANNGLYNRPSRGVPEQLSPDQLKRKYRM